MGSGAPIDRAPRPDADPPGEPSHSRDALAGRWLSALDALAGRAAHEVNNALNGAVVNVEVVRIRARPGADAGACASFAESAAGELERAVSLVSAVVGLARGAPRAGAAPADVHEVLRQVATLLGPSVVHQGVALIVDGGAGHTPTAAPLPAVRLAVTATLLAAAGALDHPTGAGRSAGVASAGAAEVVGADPADEPVRLLRCTLRRDPEPELRLTGGVDDGAGAPQVSLALPGAEDVAALASAGIRLYREGAAIVLRFPPAP